MIYGTKAQYWKDRVQAGVKEAGVFNHDKVLCQNQVKNHELGFREAGIVETIFGYSVRLRSGLCQNQVLFGGRMEGRIVSYEEALEWGKAWVDASPDYRILSYGEKCSNCTLDHHKNKMPSI